MSKSNAEALVKLQNLIDSGAIVQIGPGVTHIYEVTIWPKKNERDHHHYNGDSLVEAVMKIK